MRKLPVKEQQYRNRAAKMRELCAKPMPDFLIMLNARLLLIAYFGGYYRAAWVFIKEGTHLWLTGLHGKIVMGICDRVGWTHLKDLPNYPGLKVRHGRNCDCKDDTGEMDCIRSSIPIWFQKITGYFKD